MSVLSPADPNKDPTTTMEHGLAPTQGTTWLKPPGWGQPGYNVSRSETFKPAAGAEPGGPEAAGSSGEVFTYGVGGTMCERYTPSGGFWCSNASTGGGSGWELMVPRFSDRRTRRTSTGPRTPSAGSSSGLSGEACRR